MARHDHPLRLLATVCHVLFVVLLRRALAGIPVWGVWRVEKLKNLVVRRGEKDERGDRQCTPEPLAACLVVQLCLETGHLLFPWRKARIARHGQVPPSLCNNQLPQPAHISALWPVTGQGRERHSSPRSSTQSSIRNASPESPSPLLV